MPVSPLAVPLDLPCGQRLANRIAKSAMTEALAGVDDAPTVAHDTLYRRWSQGGISLQVTGNVMIDRRYLERPGNVVVEDRRDLDALRAWAAAGKSGGSRIWMQISHPGRQCPAMVARRPLSPSAERLRILGLFGTPREMTGADIEEVISRFATTAAIAREAGFDGVQIHAAHGYLVSQFLSPITNRRNDSWGGPLANRARLLRRVLSAVRDAVGAGFPVAVKLNSADFQKGGFSLDDSAQVAAWLDADGIDLIELSGGTYEQMSFVNGTGDDRRDSTRRREAYFLDYARELRKAVQAPLMVTGGFRSARAMEQALAGDGIDMIGLARPLCVDPDAAGDLLQGTVARVGIDEAGLLMGRGALGANARNRFVKLVNTVSSVEYYGRQMTRMSRGQPPETRHRHSALATVLRYLAATTLRALRRKIA